MKIKCTLKNLYDFEKETGYVSQNKIKVNTRHGFKNIESVDITAKNSEQYKLITRNGNTVIASPGHLLYDGSFIKDLSNVKVNDHRFKKIKDFKIGESVVIKKDNDYITDNIISLIKLEDKQDLYDIQVEGHEYIANGIVTHNSTIANAIKYLLYGKVDGINLSDLPNRINKNLWGRIIIESKSKLIEIERGSSPSIFNIKINGIEFDQAGKLNAQDYLEKEFFEIPYHVFRNIIILSINDFKSFLTMNPGDKKNIVDKLFGFSIINDMKEIVKQDRRLLKEQIKTLEDELNIIAESIISVNTKLNELEKSAKEKNTEKIKDLKDKLQKLNLDRIRLQDIKDKVKTKLIEIQSDIDKHSNLFNLKNSELNLAKSKLKLYQNKQCPECESHLDTEFQKERKQLFEYTVNTVPDEMINIKDKIESFKLSYRENESKQHQIISKVSSLDTTMTQMKNELVKIAKSMEKDGEFNQLKALITENREKDEVKSKAKLTKGDEDYYLDILENILGEDGIKNLAMKTILPTLNINIQSMVKQIHLPFIIKFDNKFNCNITSLGEEINPRTLSTGERKKADFVIIIALIKLLKLRFPTLNLLFLDEIFSSVDSVGVYEIIDILHKTVNEINLNTFVINHSPLPSELFDKRVEIFKQNGFSSLKVEDVE